MPRKRFFSVGLLLPMTLAACSSAKPLPQPLPTLSNDWTVVLTQSGGFAGVLLTVEVSNTGQLRAQNQRTGKSIEQALSQETISQLASLITDLKVSKDAATSPGCADCFIYEIEIGSGGSITKTRVDDITIGASGLEELVAFLRRLRNNALGINF